MASEQSYDHMLKLLIIGDSGVGKSSLLLRFCDDDFKENQLSTIGVDFKTKYMTVGGAKLKLAIWDTAGQERFRTLTSSYYRGAQGIIFVYDCTKKSTYEHLSYWQEEVKKYSTYQEAILMMVHNKVDLPDPEVSQEEGRTCAQDNAMMFIETSAKTRQGVKQAFEEVIRKILETPSLVQGGQAKTAQGRKLDGKTEPEVSGKGCGC